MSQGVRANGNISTGGRFLVLDTTQSSNTVLQASGTGTEIVGVSYPGSHATPLGALDDGYTAIAGLNLTMYTVGDRCQIVAGAALSAGNRLTSDSTGRAILATTGNYSGGYALQGAAAAGNIIEIRVEPMKL